MYKSCISTAAVVFKTIFDSAVYFMGPYHLWCLCAFKKNSKTYLITNTFVHNFLKNYRHAWGTGTQKYSTVFLLCGGGNSAFFKWNRDLSYELPPSTDIDPYKCIQHNIRAKLCCIPESQFPKCVHTPVSWILILENTKVNWKVFYNFWALFKSVKFLTSDLGTL